MSYNVVVAEEVLGGSGNFTKRSQNESRFQYFGFFWLVLRSRRRLQNGGTMSGMFRARGRVSVNSAQFFVAKKKQICYKWPYVDCQQRASMRGEGCDLPEAGLRKCNLVAQYDRQQTADKQAKPRKSASELASLIGQEAKAVEKCT